MEKERSGGEKWGKQKQREKENGKNKRKLNRVNTEKQKQGIWKKKKEGRGDD